MAAPGWNQIKLRRQAADALPIGVVLEIAITDPWGVTDHVSDFCPPEKYRPIGVLEDEGPDGVLPSDHERGGDSKIILPARGFALFALGEKGKLAQEAELGRFKVSPNAAAREQVHLINDLIKLTVGPLDAGQREEAGVPSRGWNLEIAPLLVEIRLERIGHEDRQADAHPEIASVPGQREHQIGFGHQDGHRVDVDAGQILEDGLHQTASRQAGRPQPADGGHEERPRAAGGVEERPPLVTEPLQRQFGQPVRRVIFAEIVSGGGVDQPLIQPFEDIFLCGGEVVFRQVIIESAQKGEEIRLDGGADRPGEEVGLGQIEDAATAEVTPRHDALIVAFVTLL